MVADKVGLASHQNAVPLLRQLSISNAGAEDLENLTLELTPTLPFAVGKTWHVDKLGAGASISVMDRDIELAEGYLANVTESMRAAVTVRLTQNAAAIAEEHYPVELLAHNQWGGGSTMPELLAVFCTPNDPAVDKVLKAASDVLRCAAQGGRMASMGMKPSHGSAYGS